MEQLLFLIPFIPFAGFLINGVFGKYLPKQVSGWLSTICVLLSFGLSLAAFSEILNTQKLLKQSLYNWVAFDGFSVDFGLMADQLSVLFMLVITGVGSLIHIYSIGYMKEDDGFYKFFAYLNLFIFSMLLLVMGSNYIMLFMGWEGVGLCSYLLIGFWYQNEEYGKAARKAFIMNRIGDLGLLIGLFLIYQMFGSFDYDKVLPAAANGTSNIFLTIATISLFIGAMGKSAQIPLYTWLPDAMAGPTPVSALIHAATMVTAGIYLIIRSNSLFIHSELTMEVIMIVGIITSIWAACIGLRQNDIKKVLAYSTVSQLGLMFVAVGAGAFSAALFHLITHAFFKALLFLGSGSVIHAMSGEQDIRKMGGLKSKIKVTYWVFLIGTLAITGIVPFSGFFSKDEILISLFGYSIPFWALAFVSSMITATYMYRLLYVTFGGEFRGTEDQKHHLHESPAVMRLPLIILAVLSTIAGVLNLPSWISSGGSTQWLSHFISPVIYHLEGAHEAHHISLVTEFILMGVTLLGVVVIALVSKRIYSKTENLPVSDEKISGISKVLSNKFYVDELYDIMFVQPIEVLSNVFYSLFDVKIIDGAVRLSGNITRGLGAVLRLFQNGNIEYYIAFMTVGVIALFIIKLFF